MQNAYNLAFQAEFKEASFSKNLLGEKQWTILASQTRVSMHTYGLYILIDKTSVFFF